MKKIGKYIITTIAVFIISVAACADSLKGLIAYYPFIKNADDESGNGLHGAVNGNPTLTDGAAGTGYYFHGGMDENICVKDFPELNTAITISAYVKRISARAQPIISRGSYGDNEPYVIWISQDHVEFNINNHNGKCVANYSVSLERYEHIVCTYDSVAQTMRIYINGVLMAESKYAMRIRPEPDKVLYIAVSLPGGREFFSGYVDEVRVYDRAISPDEARQLYEICNRCRDD